MSWRSYVSLYIYIFHFLILLSARVALTPSTALNPFSSREQENEQRANLLKRLVFTIFCSEVDQYVRSMPDVQERLADSLRSTAAPGLQAEVFNAFRVLLLRMSAPNVTSLWPIIISELVSDPDFRPMKK